MSKESKAITTDKQIKAALKNAQAEGKSHELRIDQAGRNAGRLFLRIRPGKKAVSAQYVLYWYVNGKRRKMNIGPAGEKGISLAEARRKFHDLSLLIQQDIDPADQREQEREEAAKSKQEREDAKKKEIGFSTFFEKTYYPQAKTEKKLDTCKHEWAHFEHYLKPVLGKLRLAKIETFHLEKVKKKMLDNGQTPRTVQHVFATFRQSWNLARLNGLVAKESPSKAVKLPKFDNKRLRFLSREEAESLLAALKKRSQQTHVSDRANGSTSCPP